MSVPSPDWERAHMGWILDPSQAQEAAAHDWQNALSVIISHRMRIHAERAERLQAGDREGVKECGEDLRQWRDTLTGVQSLLSSLKA